VCVLLTLPFPKCRAERHSGPVLELSGMPIYEYDCRDCRRVVSVLVLRPSAAEAPRCPRCGGAALTRLMSRFATIKSEEARLESLADSSSLGDVDENDPASVARFMKKMGREMGDDLGEDFDEVMDEALDESTSADESPDSVSSSGASDDL
jgi:putative FmdB family regulatory protein